LLAFLACCGWRERERFAILVQSSRGWGSATALEVKKKVASQTAIKSSKELDFLKTLLAIKIESLVT
jgi:hypothetical protein